jgi:hypothetical protein
VQHFIHHLSPEGRAGFVLANGALSSRNNGEGEIRQNIVKDDIVDCIVALPNKLFFTTQIGVSLWFLDRGKKNSSADTSSGPVLFIDARRLGKKVSRTQIVLTEEEIERIVTTYRSWRGEVEGGSYEDVKGFCRSATLDEIEEFGFNLSPGRYVGAEDAAGSSIDFAEFAAETTKTFAATASEAHEVEEVLLESFRALSDQDPPSGWEVRQLGDEAFSKITMGQSPPGSTYNDIGEGLPFFQGAKDFGALFPTARVFCSAPTRVAEQDDVLISVRAPIGRINRATERCAIGRGLAAIRGRRPQDTVFIEYVLRAKEAEWHALEVEGSVFGNLGKKDLHGIEFLCPPEEERDRLIEKLIEPLHRLAELRLREERAVSDLRQEIVTRMVRGELSLDGISDPEQP